MKREEIIAAWNAQADEFNQWDELGEDEKLAWAMRLEREACAQEADAEASVEGIAQRIAAAIRARENT